MDRQTVRSTSEPLVGLFASLFSKASPVSSGQGHKSLPHLGIEPGQLLNLLPHLLSFLHSEPASKGEGQGIGVGDSELEVEGNNPLRRERETLTSASLPCTVVYNRQTASGSFP